MIPTIQPNEETLNMLQHGPQNSFILQKPSAVSEEGDEDSHW